jgi:hypothetical protein
MVECVNCKTITRKAVVMIVDTSYNDRDNNMLYYCKSCFKKWIKAGNNN